MYKLKKGFTLAEILVTLAIMGVVASLVIPNLVNEAGDSEYNVSVKKIFSVLSDSLSMIQANDPKFHAESTSATKNELLRDSFCSVLTCVKTDTAFNIFGPSNYKYYKGNSSGWPASTDTTASATLNNGNFVRFIAYTNCNNAGIKACAYIDIDGNGRMGPNMIGRDIYSFWIVRDIQDDGTAYYSISPMGVTGDTYAGLPNGCVAGSTAWSSSRGCTAQRINNPDHMP